MMQTNTNMTRQQQKQYLLAGQWPLCDHNFDCMANDCLDDLMDDDDMAHEDRQIMGEYIEQGCYDPTPEEAWQEKKSEEYEQFMNEY